jgi:2-aminoethylphosphonate aminotransferase
MKRNILLNPGPATTSQGVKNAMVVPDICPREKEFGDLIEGINRDLVKIAHGDDDYVSVLFAASGTGGVEAAISSAVPVGKKILIIDNGAYGNRMVKIANAFNIGSVICKVPYNEVPQLEEVEKLLIDDDDISHLAVVQHETTSGTVNPIKEISSLAHKFGVEVIVDAMSSFPVITPNIKDIDVEYLVSSSNKCIQGMPGLVYVLVKKSSMEKLEPQRRSFYFDIYSQYQGFHSSHQMPFTPPVQVLYALRTAIDEYLEEGEVGRQERYDENWGLLYSGMKDLGFKMFLPYEQESRILFTLFEPNHNNYSFNDMHDYLYDNGFTIYPGKVSDFNTFRLAVIGDLFKEDIISFLQSVKNYLTERKIEL